MLKKPFWIKIKIPSNTSRIQNIKKIIQKNNLNSVCEEASCPNLPECFNAGSVAFMILGKICTRRCPFCNVQNGRPSNLPDANEPKRLARTILKMKLKYVVLTSVNRDDLRDGGAKQFVDCIKQIRLKNPLIRIEILVPDFRKKLERALNIINTTPPDVFNHNIETVPRLYKKVRPYASYEHSLELLKNFKKHNLNVCTKSGLMVGLGETDQEIITVMQDLYKCNVDILTIGQYLQPTFKHLPVKRYVTVKKFHILKKTALSIGFTYVACGPFIRSSYYANLQDEKIDI
ncbi:Lipoyl synthase [Candidatus Westeberhardia cardiocondylae]|uniref:Lipoyl synthase n=1 Tax=Candidatus Westeberhardia cardiocondylae TaxID=1594731 RepID=A0A0H5BX43_9ENTR|nr:lipoyl synthase [Candidatus Westeberhardia cardiocondylae]CEN32169.1 Lipoyl synthase [Candidatus Westeberhardia cardiocondylae]